MSLIDSLKNGKLTNLQSRANVSVQTGDGNSKIEVTGNNVDIKTGSGDQDIKVVAQGDIDIETGEFGADNINAIANSNANITTGGDNDTVNLYAGQNFNVNTGGAGIDSDKVSIVSSSVTGQNVVSTGNGDDTVHLIANNVDFDKDEGSLELGFFGSNYNIETKAQDNLVAGYGDNVTMALGVDQPVANNNIYTFDQLWADENNPQNTKFQDGFWQGDAAVMMNSVKANGQDIDFINEMDSVIEKFERTEVVNTTVEEELISSTEATKISETISGMSINDISKRYGIPVSVLQQYDLTATLSDKSPKYAILGRYGGSVYQLVERKEGNGTVTTLYSNGRNNAGLRSSQFTTNISSDAVKTKDTTVTTTDTYKVTTTDEIEKAMYRRLDGVANWSVTTGDGNTNGHITARGGEISLKTGDAGDQDRELVVDSGYTTREVLDAYNDVKVTTRQDVHSVTTREQIASTIKLLTTTISSPLVLDMNGDGKVSARAGLGVDVNNDGIADGAAVNGDKMLAMTDLNGNGKIDGAEVFGDRTVSPFTGEALNAKNGFEALKAVAEEAQKYTGINCLNDSQVDVKKLQEALATVGINLGFVSDDNVSELENLYGVSTVDVGNYTETERTGADVEHLQHSEFTDGNGVKRKVDDVWFKI